MATDDAPDPMTLLPPGCSDPKTCDYIRILCDRLRRDERKQIKNKFKKIKRLGEPLDVSTACTGTGICEKVTQAIVQHLVDGDETPIYICNKFAVDNSPIVQQWLKLHFPKTPCFIEVDEIQHAWAEIAGPDGETRRWQEPDTDWLVAGFSCKDFSSVNCKAKLFKDAVARTAREYEDPFAGGNDEVEESKSARTGLALIKFLETKRPALLLLENVPNFDSKDSTNFITFRQLVNGLGYSCTIHMVNALDYLLPQSRKRLYMVVEDRDLPGALPQDDLQRAIDSTLNDLVVGNLPLEMFLGWPELDFDRPKKRATKQREDVKWKEAHKTIFEARSMEWREPPHAELMALSPDYATLADRERSEADFYHNLPVPEDKVRSLVDLSQSLVRDPADVMGSMVLPTLRPRALLWDRVTMALLPIACTMRAQGLHPSEWPFAKRFSPSQLKNFVGNAFASTSIMAVLLACLVHCRLPRRYDLEMDTALEDELVQLQATNALLRSQVDDALDDAG